MQGIFIAFMIMVTVMCLFSTIAVMADIIKSFITKKQPPVQQQPVAPVAPAPIQPVPECTCQVEPQEEVAATQEETQEVVEQTEEATISFATGTSQTLEEKYLDLPNEVKGWYDEIIKYANNIEGSKRFKNERYEEYKLGNTRLVRLLIKRGIIHCEFMLQNSSFRNYATDNKISFKQSATVLKVISEEALNAVKNSIDIVVESIAEDKERKKAIAREKRRAKRMANTTGEEQ